MKYPSKVIVLFILVSLLMSCKTVKVDDVFMQKFYPGVPSGTSGIKYGFQLTNTKTIVIDKISFVNQEIAIKDYSIIRIPDGKMFNKKSDLNKGVYHIDFLIEDSISGTAPNDESIKVEYMVSNTKKSLIKKINLKSNFISK